MEKFKGISVKLSAAGTLHQVLQMDNKMALAMDNSSNYPC